MGIINNDVYECLNGVQKAGTYISFATETIYLVQNYPGMLAPMPDQSFLPSPDRSYNVRANYRIFWDQAAREAGKSFIDLKSVNVVLTEDQLNSNIYKVLYEELKKIYPNTSDELRVVAPEESESAPVAPAESAPVADAPTESVPAESAPVADAPAESAPVADAPAESAPVVDAPAESAPAESAPTDAPSE
jgi:hypothetical protein